MALCSKCGADMGEGARFCPRGGRPREAVGAGPAGTVSESVFVEWDEVHGVGIHPDRHGVTVRRPFMPDLHVSRTPDNHAEVSSYLVRKIPGGRR
jgi:hypothetical protein